MSKKDFIAIADAIRKANSAHGGSIFDGYYIEMLADCFAKANPRFKRARWIAYVNGECGPNGGAVKGAGA